MNDYSYEEILPGMKESFQVKITEEELEAFQKLTGDTNPLHTREDYAKERNHPGRVAYGMLTASYLSTLAGVYLPGRRSLIHTAEIKLERPVYIGDVLTVEGEVTEKNDTFRFIVLKAVIKNQDGKKVLKAKLQVGVEE
ncbi:MAG: MaoC family dehydratase [Lachnospiraceae bacterium]|nr:MaoC family dehydratase [Lachnospiraceae bacterium]